MSLLIRRDIFVAGYGHVRFEQISVTKFEIDHTGGSPEVLFALEIP